MAFRCQKAGLFSALVLLQASLPLISGGQTGSDLSRDVSRPLFYQLSGVSNSEDGIIDLVEQVNDDPANLQNCGGGGDGCKMATFIVGCIVAGSIVFPILTFFCCCGFCCGRSFCKCCCKCCPNGEHCGGRYATRPYKWIEVVMVVILLFGSVLILFVFSGLGFQSLSEMKGDYDDVLDAGLELVRTPAAIIADTNAGVDDIKTVGVELFASINEDFNILADVKALYANLSANLVDLRTEVLGLQWLVEGCDAGTASCSIPPVLPPSLPAIVNPCVGGSHPIGVGALLSNSRVNPSCRNAQDTADVACQCCARCHTILSDIAEVQTQLSTDADLDGLNATLDLSELDATIDEAMGDWDQSLTDFEDTLAPVDDGVTEAKSAITADQVDGIAAGIFLLCWIVLICVLVAILVRTLGAMSGPKLAHLDWYCWWTAFVIGVFYMVIIVLPVFGWLTAAALPFETVCAILPAQGENAGDLFRLLEAADSEVDYEIKTLINECVLPTQGYIWSSANITKASLAADISSEFNVSKQLDGIDVGGTLDAQGQTSAFNQSEVDALQPAEHGVETGCPAAIPSGSPRCEVYQADMDAYKSDLEARIAKVKAASATVTAAISALQAVSASTKTKIDNIKVDADAVVLEIIDMIWELGTCSRISNAYEGLRSPLCDGVAAGLFGTWGVLFLMAFFLYLLLFLINKSAKMAYGDPPRSNQIEDEGNVPSGEVEKGIPVAPNGENSQTKGQTPRPESAGEKVNPKQEAA
mmetsp:Transcript_58870/g.138808  ORF Transcript_58870/g.138808 Transcript_58870/m.138808 type:complete len:756 (-) Transcript_58870:280-2547(-)